MTNFHSFRFRDSLQGRCHIRFVPRQTINTGSNTVQYVCNYNNGFIDRVIFV